MKKILLSIGILAAVIVVVAGATGAWFTNTETSTGNTFTAGVIDLKIDNESYVTNNDGVLVASEETSWQSDDLDKGQLFFSFNDLKPGDVGEDTISIHVGSNDAWACMDINITATPENGQTEPESLVDETTGDDQGELQDELMFVFWKDDGDNVLEWDEVDTEDGGIFWNTTLQKISDGEVLALADSEGGVLENGSPLQGGETYYIGKAWCHGELEIEPLDPYYDEKTTDSDGTENNEGPLVRGTGITCDGYPIGDASQTDGVVADVSFSVEQSRHNDNFLCNPPEEGQLTVVKRVVGGEMNASDFTLYVDDTQVGNGEINTFPTGVYEVRESNNSDYIASFSGACDEYGNVTVLADESVTCTITNTYTKGNLTVNKVVIGGDIPESQFVLYIDDNTGDPLSSGDTRAVSEGLHTVSEGSYPDYTQSFGSDCPNGTVNVPANGTATCTITNTYTKGTLTVTKIVEGGPLTVDKFDLYVGNSSVNSGVANVFPEGDYVVSEGDYPDYTTVIGGVDCDSNGNVTVTANDSASCTITNTYTMGTLTVNKVVEGTMGNENDMIADDFILYVNSGEVGNGEMNSYTAGTLLTVTEGGDDKYTPSYSGDCNSNGEVTLTVGQDAECTITNTYNRATLTVDKRITFTSVSVNVDINDFDLFIDNGIDVINMQVYDQIAEIDLPAGTYTVTEVKTGGEGVIADAEFDIDCSDLGTTGEVTLVAGDNLTCRITNEIEPIPN